MYTVIYIYRVKEIHVHQFITINEQASEIYLANGALEDNTYHADNLDGKHGCKGLIDTIRIKKNEMIFFGQSLFRNKSHFDDVMKQVSKEEKITQLYKEMISIIDMSKVITASFSTDS